MMIPTGFCIDCHKLCFGRCKACGKALCFVCAGGLLPSVLPEQKRGCCQACYGPVAFSDEAIRGLDSLAAAFAANRMAMGTTHQQIVPYQPKPAYEDMQFVPPEWEKRT